jgi:DNA repair protein RAD5
MMDAEIGRLPQNVASWVAKLLDQGKLIYLIALFCISNLDAIGIITFRGSTVVDCADTLLTGAEMLLQLRVYVLAKAFQKHQISSSSDDPRSMFNEGQETLDEQSLRERKASLQQLFKAIDLTPRRPNTFLRDPSSNVNVLETVVQSDPVGRPDKRKEKVGLDAMDGTEDPEEEDDAELLSEGQLDMIYKKC